MKLMRMLAASAAFATTALLFAAPASAQATRTWVSGVGDDANPCSRTAPCKTFAGAIVKTVPGGEIDCLDPGGFGALTITKSITLDCKFTSNGGVLVAGTNGIVVAISGVTGAKVQLIGLDFDGLGAPDSGATGSPGINGVVVSGTSTTVSITDSVIYGFTTTGVGSGDGVQVSGTSVKVYIQNSVIRNNNAGVNITSAATGSSVILDHVYLDNNTTTTASVDNGNLMVGSGAVAILNASTLTNSTPGVTNSGTTQSYGNNVIRGGISGTALTTIARQ